MMRRPPPCVLTPPASAPARPLPFPLAGALVTLLLLTLPVVRAAETFSQSKAVVALKPDKDPDAMIGERRAAAAFLASALGKPVDVIVPLSGAVINEGLANGTIDLAFVSATDLVNARRNRSGSLLLAVEIAGKTTYESYWVSLREKPYQSVADLRGRPVAFASRTSTSGFVVPLHDLHQRGLVSDRGRPEEFFGTGNVFFGTGYVSAIERVLRGEAEAAAVSYYVLDEDKHLTPEQRQRLKKVCSQGPVPTHVLAVSHRVSEPDREALKRALLRFNEPAGTALRDRLFVSRLVEVDEEAHVASLDAALRLARGE